MNKWVVGAFSALVLVCTMVFLGIVGYVAFSMGCYLEVGPICENVPFRMLSF